MSASGELRIEVQERRQKMIEAIGRTVHNEPPAAMNMASSPILTNELLSQIAIAIVETGGVIAEQICQLREAVERLANSLPGDKR